MTETIFLDSYLNIIQNIKCISDGTQVAGGAAGADGRLMKGDQILAVNSISVRKASQEEAAAVLKTTSGKVTLKMGRLKARSSATGSDK